MADCIPEGPPATETRPGAGETSARPSGSREKAVFGALIAAMGVVYFLTSFSSVTAPEFATATASSPAWTRWLVEHTPVPVCVARGRALVNSVANLHASGHLFYIFLILAVPVTLMFLRRLNPGAVVWRRETPRASEARARLVMAEDRLGAILYLSVVTVAVAAAANIAASTVTKIPLLVSAIQGALLGACAWLLWSPSGAAHRFAPLRAAAAARRPWWHLALRGATAGALFLVLVHPESWDTRMWLIAHIRGFGDYALAPWAVLGGAGALFYAVKFWLGGCIGYGLAGQHHSDAPLIERLCWPLVALLVCTLTGSALYLGVFVPQYDVGRELGDVVRIEAPAAPRRTLVTFLGPSRPPLLGVTRNESADGLPLCQEGVEAVQAFAKSRNHRTALSEAAFSYVFEASCAGWALDREIEALAASCEQCAFWGHAALLLDLLGRCRITPAGERAARTLADTRYFEYPTDGSRQAIAGLLIRFGHQAEASEWLEAAGGSRQSRAQTAGSPSRRFDQGTVRGRILVNGGPASGLRVGVVMAHNAGALAGDVPPLHECVLCAGTRTDPGGRFILDRLGLGVYLLVISAETNRLPPAGSRLRFERPPGQIPIRDYRPGRDLGDIRVQVLPRSAAVAGAKKAGGNR